MRGQMKTGRRVFAVLFASTALGLAQVNPMSALATPLRGSNNAPYGDQTPAQVGPGTVNYIEGQVSIAGQEISSQDVGGLTVLPGQQIDTGNGYLELLLTPGAFLRIGPNSEIRMLSAGLADTHVEFVRGAGMLEVDQLIKGTNLAVAMDGGLAQIERKGLYNFDTAKGAVRVLEGKAAVTQGARTKTIGKNDEVLLTGLQFLKHQSFDVKTVEADPLYVWSSARSEDESQANVAAASNPTYYAVAGPGWFWDPYTSSYGFSPIGGSLYSPFGWGFYSPGYFGYYGAYLGSHGWYKRPGWHRQAAGVNARISAFHSSGLAHSSGTFQSGFHGGFHGGFGSSRR